MATLRIPAVYMRGGTSKGVFFNAADLPPPGPARDRLLLRVIGSPDRFRNHIDGMGGATSSTSKVVLLSPSTRADCDIDYLFGQVAIDRAVVDWSGNCGNLSAAVGPCAIGMGLMTAPPEGHCVVRIWQANIGRRILAHVPMHHGEVMEQGAFELDAVAFPGAEIRLDFLDPGQGGRTFPTGSVVDALDVPGVGRVEATLIDAGNPTVFVNAAALGLQGIELPAVVDADAALLERAERVRAQAAVAMGLAASAAEATSSRPHTPKLACVSPSADYATSSGAVVTAASVDVVVRIFSMGRLHHAVTGTGAVALAAAAAVPGTVVARAVRAPAAGPDTPLRIGHPAGSLRIAAQARCGDDGAWAVTRVTMSRSARRLMAGWVFVPDGLPGTP